MQVDTSALKVAIIGLGYVGLPLAVEFGKSRPVVGFDTVSNALLSCNPATTIRLKQNQKN